MVILGTGAMASLACAALEDGGASTLEQAGATSVATRTGIDHINDFISLDPSQ
jgi:hypothetical protein